MQRFSDAILIFRNNNEEIYFIFHAHGWDGAGCGCDGLG